MNPRIVLLSGGVLMMVGAFFPWGKIDTLLHDVSLLGIRGVGILTLAIGAVIAVLALLGKAQSEQRASITGAVLGVIGGAIALFAFTKPLIATPQALPDALLAAGIGLYITTAGAVLAVIGGVQKLEPGAELDWISGILHWLGTTLKLMTYNKAGFIGFLATSAILIISLVGPFFIPLDTKTKLDVIYQPPSAQYWMGTDHQGRDIFSQIVHGGKDVIYVAAIAAFLSTAIAVTFGTLSAFAGGKIDGGIMGVTNIILTIPQFPLLAVLAAFITFDNITYLGLFLGVLGWPALLRAVRSQALSLKERDFVEAARALDLGTGHIVFRELVPNMMTYIVISFTLALTAAVYTQVGLVLLGLVPVSSSNWGVMISLAWTQGAIYFGDAMWRIMMPILAIAIFQLSVITMTRSLELAFNPRLRTMV
jgi:peptide/nickel transport system permease protein